VEKEGGKEKKEEKGRWDGRGKGDDRQEQRTERETEERRGQRLRFVFGDDRNTLHAKHLMLMFLMRRTLRC